MKKFNEKVALITGATSGIGEAAAKMFAEHGASVVLVGRNKEKGSKLEQEIIQKGQNAYFIACDVSKEEDVTEMVNKAVKKYKKIDILFNNAGVMLPSCEIERMPVDDWKKSIDINLTGCFLVSRYVKPYLIKVHLVVPSHLSYCLYE